MKKIITIALSSVVLALAFLLVACGGVNYGGKFTEVTDEAKIAQIVEDIETAAEGLESWTGVKMTMNFKTVDNGDSYEFKGTSYIVGKEMKSEYSGKSDGKKAEIRYYIKDGTFYVYSKYDGETEKYKSSNKDLFDYIGFTPDSADLEDMIYEIDSIITSSSLKISVTSESGARNIKITDEDSNTTIIIAMDKDNKIIGMKMETKMVLGKSSMEASFTYELYSGQITFPGDLDTYTDFLDF